MQQCRSQLQSSRSQLQSQLEARRSHYELDLIAACVWQHPMQLSSFGDREKQRRLLGNIVAMCDYSLGTFERHIIAHTVTVYLRDH